MLHSMLQRLAATATIALPIVLAALQPASVHAQMSVVRQGVSIGGTRVPLATLPTPPSLTADEQRRREEALAQSRPSGPPLRVDPGFSRQSPVLPETGAPRAPSEQGPSAAGPSPNPPASAAFRFFLTHAQTRFLSPDQPHANELSLRTSR